MPVNQEESLVRTSTLYPSLLTEAATQFYTHHYEDPDNAYYTHAMVYSPAVVIFRDDDGEWRSPVEVDVLTSAAVNVGDIRRGLEKEERLRIERLELEYWKRKGKERRKQPERAMAERQGLREEAKNKNEKEIAMLKKEQADMKEEILKLKNLVKEMDKRKESDREKIEEEEGEVEVENQEENQENTFDNPALGCGSDSQPKSRG